MKTSELSGAALDWAVAKCEGFDFDIVDGGLDCDCPDYSTDWEQGGAIIEREYLFLAVYDGVWEATKHSYPAVEVTCEGETPLIAAMRCYVASKLGDEVEVPDELA